MIFNGVMLQLNYLNDETEKTFLKKIVITFIECICFFLGWAILSAVLPLSNSDNPCRMEIMGRNHTTAVDYGFYIYSKQIHDIMSPKEG